MGPGQGHHAQGLQGGIRQFVEAGWNALQAPAEHGGRGSRSSSRRRSSRCGSRRSFFLARHDAHGGRGRGLDPARTEQQKSNTCRR